jgi:hypothetical protein
MRILYALFKEKYKTYGNGEAEQVGVDGEAYRFRRGVNYGRNVGWDPFDVLNSMINPDKQRPTRNCTINVTPTGTTGDC